MYFYAIKLVFLCCHWTDLQLIFNEGSNCIFAQQEKSLSAGFSACGEPSFSAAFFSPRCVFSQCVFFSVRFFSVRFCFDRTPAPINAKTGRRFFTCAPCFRCSLSLTQSHDEIPVKILRQLHHFSELSLMPERLPLQLPYSYSMESSPLRLPCGYNRHLRVPFCLSAY